MPHRCRSKLGGLVATVCLLLTVLQFEGARLFLAAPQARSPGVVARQAGKRQTNLSPDDTFQVPRTKEEEKEASMWKSDFDDLPAEDKLSNPWVVAGFATITIPIFIGVVVLITNGAIDE
eukprot:TRINITY_DN44169_c0_g1_i1.p1 TRINITY_DN44169_c0_g1~~TRINITY_DN44169_c0_g1_i1.p1  ORF type:complete len:120 (-),score=23.43 TRINITY_DN44169_c0_g1_i1:375-734(-)